MKPWITILASLIFPFLSGCAISNQQSPPYPPQALNNGWSGTVVLRVLVGDNYRPYSVEVAQSSGHEILDESAKNCVAKWTFPTKAIGTNTVPISFKINSNQH